LGPDHGLDYYLTILDLLNSRRGQTTPPQALCWVRKKIQDGGFLRALRIMGESQFKTGRIWQGFLGDWVHCASQWRQAIRTPLTELSFGVLFIVYNTFKRKIS